MRASRTGIRTCLHESCLSGGACNCGWTRPCRPLHSSHPTQGDSLTGCPDRVAGQHQQHGQTRRDRPFPGFQHPLFGHHCSATARYRACPDPRTEKRSFPQALDHETLRMTRIGCSLLPDRDTRIDLVGPAQPGPWQLRPTRTPMWHRHLNHEGYSLAAIDDVIARGRWADWVDLRRAVHDDPPLLERVERICRSQLYDSYTRRHHFWMHSVQTRRRRGSS